MDDRLKRVLVTGAGAVSAALGLFFVLTWLNAGLGFAGCTGTSALGWTIPLFSGGLIGGVAWVLLARGPKYFDDTPADPVPCVSCGRGVMPDWRLCPFCGTVQPRTTVKRTDLAGTR